MFQFFKIRLRAREKLPACYRLFVRGRRCVARFYGRTYLQHKLPWRGLWVDELHIETDAVRQHLAYLDTSRWATGLPVFDSRHGGEWRTERDVNICRSLAWREIGHESADQSITAAGRLHALDALARTI
jgi:hypothetical protein